jgi:hypothetical protein
MTLGKSPTSEDAFRSGTSFCRDHVSETSIYALLYRESHRLFPDEAFAVKSQFMCECLTGNHGVQGVHAVAA